MLTTAYNGCIVTIRPELGRITLAELRDHMAVIRTERGVTFICNVTEPNPQAGRVEMPCDQEAT